MKILFGFFVFLLISLTFLFLFFLKQKNNFSGTQFETSKSSEHISPTPFSIKEAPSQSLKGNLDIVQGDVLVQDRVATNSAIISNSTTVQQGEKIETNKTGLSKIKFQEILNLTIFPESSIDIVQTLPIDLVFSLVKGKVEFEKLGSNTISLRVKHLLIKIDGNVEVILDEDKPLITTYLKTGSITIAYNNLRFETQSLTVEGRGKTIIFNDSTRKVVQE